MIRVRAFRWMVPILLAVMVVTALPSLSHAQTPPPPTSTPAPPSAAPATPPATTSGSTTPVNTCTNYPGLTNKIAACVRHTLYNVTTLYFDGFYKLVSHAIQAFLTIGVAIYGVMAAMGMIEKVGRDTIMLVLKISMIAFFTTNCDLMYDQVIKMMDATGEAVVHFTPSSGLADNSMQFDQITCLNNMRDAATAASVSQDEGIVAPWLAMDCLIDTIIGIKFPDNGHVAPGSAGAIGAGVKNYLNNNFSDSDKGLSRGMLYVFFSGMQSSIIGIILAIIGFIFIYGLLFLIVKSLFTYLGGYIGLAFLMVIAPLFIPLVLFRPTSEYFAKWVKLLLSFALQPVIILVFVVFSISAVDLAMFSGDYSLMYRIAGDASRTKPFSLNKYLEDNKAIISKPTKILDVKANADTSDVTGKLEKGLAAGFAGTSQCFQAGMSAAAAAACKKTYPYQMWHNSIDWKALAAARKPAVTVSDGATSPEQQLSREVLAAAIFCGIIVFVMNGLLAVVPMVANDLIGDLIQSPALYAHMSKLPGQDQLKSLTGGIGQQISNMVTPRK